VGAPSAADTFAGPLQLFHLAIFNAMSQQPVSNPMDQPMTLISNSTYIAPIVRQGVSAVQMALTGATVQFPNGQMPAVTFDGGGDITASVTGKSTIHYAVPGNSYPSESTVLFLEVNVSGSARTGLRNLFLTNSGQSQAAAMPALLNVISS
jgi:hypothetical protein